MQFNEKLKKLRLEKGLSQTALAEKIFVSRSAVAKWENGLGLPSDQSLNLLADFFEVDPSELLSDPIAENVIVTKNSTISNQKIWILSILIFTVTVSVLLTALCIYFAAHRETPILSRHLIFETEKELDLEGIVNYPDDTISADNSFIDTRVFEIKQSVGSIRLPQLLVKTTINGVASYETVDPSSVTFSFSDHIILRHEAEPEQNDSFFIHVLPADYYDAEFCDWANIKYGDLLLSIKVFRNRVPVESVTVGFDDHSSEIGLTQSKVLSCDIKPYNANDTDFSYVIDKIINPDGERYGGNLTQYAYIENHYLTTTKHIEIGSVIYLSAITSYDNVKSNVFAVTVTRIAIERISLTLPNSATYIFVGESKPLTLNVFPEKATFNVLEEQAKITLLTPEFATLEQGVLTVSADPENIGEKISVKVETPEGINQIFSWEILKAPTESSELVKDGVNNGLREVVLFLQNSLNIAKPNDFSDIIWIKMQLFFVENRVCRGIA